MIAKIPIFSHTQRSFVEQLFSLMGKGKLHSAQMYARFLKHGDTDVLCEPQARTLFQEMLEHIDFSLPTLSLLKEEGEIVKFLLKYKDGLESESVVIPMESGITLCISSQVGCQRGCAFCETGRMGLLRNLSAAEIVSQVFFAQFCLKKPVRNIVFMGMGEPLDNFTEVKKAVEVLMDPGGFAFGPRRITISTSGVVDKIYAFIEEMHPGIHLAVSVNAATNKIRNKIMPINKQWDMEKLKEVLLCYSAHPRRSIFAEYVLLEGVNDTFEDAENLARYLQGLRVKVNLIPYNSQSRYPFAAPSFSCQEAFAKCLRERGYQVYFRHPKGREIMAACGQLGKRYSCNFGSN